VREQYGEHVLFIVLYQREAHAGEYTFKEVEQPETYEEREKLAQKSCSELGIGATVVIDEMDNSVRTTYGQLPNSAYIIDKSGKIVYKEAWAHPENWGAILDGLLEAND
jgi:hypothetical protein